MLIQWPLSMQLINQRIQESGRRKPERSQPPASSAGTSLQFDREVLEDFLLDLPGADEVLFNSKGVAGLDRHGLATLGRDDDLALDHVDEFRRRVGGVISARHRAPPSGDRRSVVCGIFDPGLHGRVASDLLPSIEIRLNRRCGFETKFRYFVVCHATLPFDRCARRRRRPKRLPYIRSDDFAGLRRRLFPIMRAW